MRLTGVSPESGRTGLTVRTALANPSTRPGLLLPGRVVVSAGSVDVPVLHVRLGLVTSAEPDDPEAPRRLVQFHQVEIATGFVLRAGRARSIPFSFPLPWETPVTVVGGAPLLSLRMGLRTEVAIEPGLDQGAMVPLFVHPLIAQAHILTTLEMLGFSLRQAGSVAARLPGVEQQLALHQRLGYWVAPLYSGPITELEVIFIANSAGLEVLLWCDRRLALAGITHQSISRFRIWHHGAERRDWVSTVDGWLRSAINRHAAMAAHADWSAPINESAHVSRPPDAPLPPGFGLGGTAGGPGVGGGGGGGDGT
ncbi:sporulation protein [Salinispora sp. H7-4]|uniref:sporulation protein n=1 Tax=Salinispora sp. H7-4 TaxID=2748321 RepID=UPI0015D13A1B|nr:sporulation protein [Salinispora sp. H7-4]NYT93765.1 sporulation protein [Salinispora sp. H7-4]